MVSSFSMASKWTMQFPETKKMKKTISFEIELDENHLAEKIKMSSADSDKDIDKIKSILISMWDSNQTNSLNISLWTKDMPLNDMFIFYHQTLITMAKNLEKQLIIKKCQLR